MAAGICIDAEMLGSFVAAIFRARGMPAEHAARIAEVLIWADLRGIDSHGVVRAPRYLGFLDRGEMAAIGEPLLHRTAPAAFQLEARRTAGAVAMMQAVEQAIADAARSAVVFGLVQGTTHIGPAGYYAEQVAARGMIALVIAAGLPNMAYHGARTLSAATAPIAIGVPSLDGPLLLDMATAVAASGKLRQAIQEGRPIPEGWALDTDGNPTTDPAKAAISLPLGGPKGSGLALMFECMTGVLAGVPALAPVLAKTAKGHVQNAALFVIDVGHFRPLDDFRRDVAALGAMMKGQPRLDGVDEILLPGERGNRAAAERRRNGIPLARKLWDELARAGEALGVPVPRAL